MFWSGSRSPRWVLTGWVLGQLPDDADAVAAAEREVIGTLVGGLRRRTTD